jgi:hypothetical protein
MRTPKSRVTDNLAVPKVRVAGLPALAGVRCPVATAAALTPSKGRLIRCTVLGSTPKHFAILLTPCLWPGVLRVAEIWPHRVRHCRTRYTRPQMFLNRPGASAA